MRRPGNLKGVATLRSRKVRTLGNLGFLASFGKGAYVPVPTAPGAAPVTGDAINRSTGKYYVQDPQCPEGEKMLNVPCAGDECCDIVGNVKDCDPPGTMMSECGEDPDYLELPEGTWTSCHDVKNDPAWKGFPGGIIMDYCKAQGLPEKAVAAKAAAASASAAASSADKQKLEAELMALELEAQQADTPTMPIIPDASATYTGGSGSPGYIPLPSTASAKEPETEQSKIMALVAAHEAKKSPQSKVLLPPITVPAPQAAPVAKERSGGIQGIFSWLQNTLFGMSPSSGLGAYGDAEMSPLVKVALISGVAYVLYKNIK